MNVMIENQQDVNIGALYKGIKTEGNRQEDLIKPEDVKDPKYVSWAKLAYKKFPNFSKSNLHLSVKDAVLFLGWKLKPEEYNALIMTVTILGLGALLFLTILIYIISTFVLSKFTDIKISSNFITLIFFFVFGIILLFVILHLKNYPKIEAEKEQRKSLAYLPAMVGYMTMYLKLVPNLERAVIFAAKQGEGHLANDFRKILWDTNLGLYSSISEGLDYLSYKWEKYSKDFKEAVMMIKSAMVEDGDARRAELLDKSSENLLSSIKLKMETYARGLSQPSLVLFYIGVLLPLLLVIILPIGSVFAKLPFANPWILALLYDVAIPVFVFLYGKKISRTVPLLYKPPVISDDYKGLPKKNHFRIGKLEVNLYVFLGLIFIIGLAILIFAHIQFGNTIENVMIKEQFAQQYIDNPDSYFEMLANNYISSANLKVAEGSARYKEIVASQKLMFSLQPEHDTTPYIILYGLAILSAIIIFLWGYFSSKYKLKIQKYYMDMEENFREVLYILASRLSEGKPMETALRETKEFFPNLVISQDFLAKTLDNINLLSMPLDQALFDPMFGSLKNNPSLLIKNNMKIIADSSSLGVSTVSKTILSISMQLKNIEDIRLTVQKLTDDVRQMMTTMASIIAPAVLGMVSAIQKVVILTLSSMGSSGGLTSSSSTSDLIKSSTANSGLKGIDPSALMSSIDTSSIGSMATPFQFNIILLIDLILIVFGLIYFISKVQSDSDIDLKINIYKLLPIAIIVFVLSSAGASILLG